MIFKLLKMMNVLKELNNDELIDLVTKSFQQIDVDTLYDAFYGLTLIHCCKSQEPFNIFNPRFADIDVEVVKNPLVRIDDENYVEYVFHVTIKDSGQHFKFAFIMPRQINHKPKVHQCIINNIKIVKEKFIQVKVYEPIDDL